MRRAVFSLLCEPRRPTGASPAGFLRFVGSKLPGCRWHAALFALLAVALVAGCGDSGRYDNAESYTPPADPPVAADQQQSQSSDDAAQEDEDGDTLGGRRPITPGIGGTALPGSGSVTGDDLQRGGSAGRSSTPSSSPPQGQGQSPPPTERTEADVGVGRAGRSLGEGILMTPVKAFFTSREHVAFRIQIPQAMNYFQATYGRKPQSHEEFMREIIQANQIPLPELPPGHRYVYDPQRGELMVEQPAPQGN